MATPAGCCGLLGPYQVVLAHGCSEYIIYYKFKRILKGVVGGKEKGTEAAHGEHQTIVPPKRAYLIRYPSSGADYTSWPQPRPRGPSGVGKTRGGSKQ
jgi:hypothetical protein